MKFIQVNIYGFGKWVDKVIDFPNNHPLCFYGENESGKSTLQQFIMYVLFGLPPRKLAAFKPIHSNKIGGRLIVEDTTVGTYQIERIDQEVICYLPTGDLQDEAWLKDRLQGLNRDIYTAIYSFSAMDLTMIRQMKQTELSDVLFSVGLTGSTKIYEAEKLLQTKIGQLFKKQGRKPLINQQINTVRESHNMLMERQQNERTYEQKQSKINQLLKERTQTLDAEAQIKSTLLKTEKVMQMLPQLQQYQQYKKETRTDRYLMKFPENGVQRLAALQEKLLPLKGELRVAKMQLQKDEQAVANIEKRQYNTSVIQSAANIVQNKTTYDYLMQQEKTISAKMHHLQEEVTTELAAIQLDKESVHHLELPFHLEKDWRELQQTHEQLLQKEESQTEHYDVLINKEAELEKARTYWLQQQISDAEMQHATHQAGATTVQDTEQIKWRQWEKQRMKTAKVILLTASIMAVLTFLFSLHMDHAILFTIPIVILLAGVVQFLNTKNTISFVLKESMNNDRQQEQDATPTQFKLEQQRIHTELQAIEEQSKQVEMEKFQWKEQQNVFLEKENNWIQLMEAEQQKYPFLQHVELEYWLDLLNILRKARRLQLEIGQSEKELNQVQAEISSMDQERQHISEQLSESNTLLTFEQIQEVIDKQHTEEHFLQQYRENMAHRIETIHLFREKIAVYDKEISKLYDYAKVEDEEAYLQLASMLKHQQMVQQEMERMEQSFAKLLTQEELTNLLDQSMDENDLTVQLNALERELKQVQHQLAELNKKIATLQMEVKQLEMSEDHSTAIYQHQIELDTLQQMAQEWATLKIAQSALLTAKTSYQKQHLDEVIKQTSLFFREITDGAYTKVIAPNEKDDVFQVEGKQQFRYTIDKLSQGTMDQLYVSLRLAISVVMSKTYHVPFLMDDAFVHFDQVRIEKMIHILKAIPSEQQLIIFTCRMDIAKAMDQVHTLY